MKEVFEEEMPVTVFGNDDCINYPVYYDLYEDGDGYVAVFKEEDKEFGWYVDELNDNSLIAEGIANLSGSIERIVNEANSIIHEHFEHILSVSQEVI